MRYVEFAAGGVRKPMSVLGFGCAAVLGRASRRQSEQAIGAALDAGINFFDTARSYGYGASEGLLGSMFAGRRESIVLCTKFGIVPGARGGWKQRLKPLARVAVNAFPGLRKAAQRSAGDQLVAGQFTLETLRASFETSLRELRTDHVDMLLLHAAPLSALAQDDLLAALGRLVEEGKVGMAGISAEQPVIEQFFRTRPARLSPGLLQAGLLQTAQFALNLSTMAFAQHTADNADLLLVANHPFGGPGGNASSMLARLRAAIPPALAEKMPVADPQVLPEVVLNTILNGTGVSAVIPAMMQTRHIESNVRAVTECRFSADELALMRQVLAEASQPGGPSSGPPAASSAPSA